MSKYGSTMIVFDEALFIWITVSGIETPSNILLQSISFTVNKKSVGTMELVYHAVTIIRVYSQAELGGSVIVIVF